LPHNAGNHNFGFPSLKIDTMAPRKKVPSVYQLKITLRDIRPPIWRRVQVRSDVTLGHLHWVIQRAMGWTNSHLHSFSIQGIEYSMRREGFQLDELEMRNEQSVTLSKVLQGETFKFFYLYDFGDSWEHEVLVEKILPMEGDTHYPVCIKAKRACPPEDCGGVWGYEELLDALKDPAHPEHDSGLDWLGRSFDPEGVELDKINTLLKEIPHDTANFHR
jgi:hypothetical protein